MEVDGETLEVYSSNYCITSVLESVEWLSAEN